MTKDIKEIRHFHISPSNQFALLSNALHCLAILAGWISDLNFVSQLILTVNVIMFWWMANWRSEATPVYLSYTGDNEWRVSSDGKNYLNAVILDTTVITSTVVFLHYKTESQACKALLIAKDSLSHNEFRRLRVRLALLKHGQE